MKMRKLIGLCAAAVFAAGSGGVHALKLMPDGAAPADLNALMTTGVDSITYAKETLIDTSATTVEDSDDVKYYRIDRVHAVAAPTTVGTVGSGDDYLVSIQLDGMVFSVGSDGGDAPTLTIAGTANAGTLILNGTDGSSSAVFQVPGTVATGAIITLLAEFAIGADGVGSIERTDRNRTLEGVVDNYSEQHSLSGAIKASPALMETVKPAKYTPTAKAALGFKMFAGEPTMESLGTIQIGVRGGDDGDATGDASMQYRNARAASNVTMLSTITADVMETDENSATFAGNVGVFVDSMGLGTGTPDPDNEDGICSAIAADMRTMEDGEPTGELDVQQVDTFYDVKTLCVHVDGEMAIPETAPYTVTTEYAGIADAAFPPEGKTHNLSPINRDGAYFHIPYVTTHDSYNQRVVIVNRGAATTYEFVDLQAEGGMMPSAGAMASGDLPTGQTVVRSTGIISGVTRGSATLTVVAPPNDVSAAVQQVNISTGGVDSVYLPHGNLSGGHLDP